MRRGCFQLKLYKITSTFPEEQKPHFYTICDVYRPDVYAGTVDKKATTNAEF